MHKWRTLFFAALSTIVALTLASSYLVIHYRNHAINAARTNYDLSTLVNNIDVDLNVASRKNADLMALIRQMDIDLSGARKMYFDLKSFGPGLAASISVFENGIAPSLHSKTYHHIGGYLGYGATFFKNDELLKIDSAGLPTVKYGDTYHYNPVTIAQFALAEYSRDSGPSQRFIPAAEYLLGMMGPDGAFRYDFPFEQYATGKMYQPGWISGMAQGQALSVFARAYHVTKDEKYKVAGAKALAFMLLDESKGGPLTTLEKFAPEPSSAPFIMEYPQDPPVYTLNGYMFSILGLFDWSAITQDPTTAALTKQFVDTLKLLLPYYDMGSISAYDLSYITVPIDRSGNRSRPHVSAPYHSVHIELLWAIHNLTGDITLAETADRWLSYINDSKV